MTQVVVIGGGVGGMVAALRARRHGADVTLIEARSTLGGLASAVHAKGLVFDGGPYILLDRVRLAWALHEVGIDLADVPMTELDPAYRLHLSDNRQLEISSDLTRTVRSIDAVQPGAGPRYRQFADKASKALAQLAPLLVRPHGPRELITSGAWRAAPWAGLSLNQVLRRQRLSGLAADAVRIWTYIAGGDPRRAPGPLALVPALIHRDGAARPTGGIHEISRLLEQALLDAEVEIVRSSPVTAINHDAGGVKGVTIENGAHIGADIVISDIGGAAALLDLVDVRPPLGIRMRLAGPLQSPGVAAYLSIRGAPTCEVSFRVTGTPKRATAFIAATNSAPTNDRRTARVIAPLSHDDAAMLGAAGQQRMLDDNLSSPWWRDGIDDVEVVHTRLVHDWGRDFRLRDDAMNLVMARRQLLTGRLPHRIKHLPGLFLTGSWTHPGQWISFCSVSGVLAADRALAAG